MPQRARALLTLVTIATDMAMAALAFFLSHRLREWIPLPTALYLGPFRNYLGQMVIQVAAVLITFFFYRLYHLRRGGSRVDLFYRILAAVSIATVVAIALSYLNYRGDRVLARGMLLYGWALTIPLVTLGRVFTNWLERRMRRLYPERLLLVGTGEMARVVLQKTVQSPILGYRVIGFVNGVGGEERDIAGVPVLGPASRLADIVLEHDVAEVIIALPEASHDELLDMISACEGGHVVVRIFPDVFQIIASNLGISDLDGSAAVDGARCGVAWLEVDPQAGHGRAGQRRRPGGHLAVPHDGLRPDSHRVQGAGLLYPGAGGPRRQTVCHDKVPLHAGGRRAGHGAGVGQRGRSAADAPGELFCARVPSTSCHSSSTC